MMKCLLYGVLMLVLTTGCGQGERVARVALTANRQQSEQNQRMVDLHQELIAGTKRLVEADGRARQEMVELHREVGDQLAQVSRQRDRLDEERRTLGEDRRRESAIARAIESVGILLAGLLPLAVSLVVLWPRPETAESAELATLLVEDLMASEPRLLVRESHRDSRIGRDEQPAGRLPGPAEGLLNDESPTAGPSPETEGDSEARGNEPSSSG